MKTESPVDLVVAFLMLLGLFGVLIVHAAH